MGEHFNKEGKHHEQNPFKTEFDPEYIAERRLKKMKASEIARPFGAEVFDEETAEDQKEVLEEIQCDLDSIIEYAQNLEGEEELLVTQEIRGLFIDGLTDGTVRIHPEVQTITEGLVGHPQAAVKLLTAYNEDRVSPELFKLILRRRNEVMLARQKEFDRELPKLRENFLRSLAKLASDSTHPLDAAMIPSEVVNRRLDEVAVFAIDPLIMLLRDARVGEFDFNSNYATMLYDRPYTKKEGRSHAMIYTHEMLHVISGRTIYKQSNHFERKKIGLDESGDILSWLNEAVTETLTQDTIGRRQYLYGSYVPERQIYKNLLKCIPEQLFLWAYFENGVPSSADSPLPHMEALLRATDNAYGKEGFLNLLDRKIEVNGTEEVEECFDMAGNWKG